MTFRDGQASTKNIVALRDHLQHVLHMYCCAVIRYALCRLCWKSGPAGTKRFGELFAVCTHTTGKLPRWGGGCPGQWATSIGSTIASCRFRPTWSSHNHRRNLLHTPCLLMLMLMLMLMMLLSRCRNRAVPSDSHSNAERPARNHRHHTCD